MKTNTHELLDQSITNCLNQATTNIVPSDTLMRKMELDYQQATSSPKKHKIVIRKKLSAGILIALLGSSTILLGATHILNIQFKRNNLVTPDEYMSYEDVPLVEKSSDLHIPALKSFSNGYTVQDLVPGTTDLLDVNHNIVGNFKDLSISYYKKASPGIYLDICKKQDWNNSNSTENYKVISYKTTNIYYNHENFKGKDIYSLSWEMYDCHYYLCVFNPNISSDEIIQMAQELIDAS